MTEWVYAPFDKYWRQVKYYEKKHCHEFVAVTENLARYIKALQFTGSPQYITGKYVRKEPMGIKALNESGERKIKNLQSTRLYIYPDVATKTLYLLTIGSKKKQPKDIKLCKDMVKKIREDNDG